MDQFINAVLALTPTPIIQLDRDGRIVTWSNAAAQYFGRPTARAIGQPLTDLLSAAAAASCRALLTQASTGEHGLLHTGDAMSPLAGWQARALCNHDTQLTGYCVVIREPTFPFTAEALDPAAHRIFFEQVPGLSFIARIETPTTPELLVLSPQWDMAFGYSLDVWNRSREERDAFVHPDDRARRRAALDRTAPDTTTYSVDYRLLAADGSVHWVRERANRFIDMRSSHAYWVGYVLDITPQKDAEANATAALTELRETNEQLALLSAAKTDFVANISHEFRTPLTSIQGYSELLQSESLSHAEVSTFARTIHDNAARLARMVSNVLDLEALEAGQRQVRRELLDLHAIALRVLDALQPLVREHRVRASFPPGLPRVTGDPELIEQVITNIVANAIKYSPNGGLIAIEARQRPAAIEITIADEGLGVPPEHRERIFSRYGRIMRTEQFGIEGTGLGLPIARHILEIHNGRIWVEGNEPKGSVFHIVLPAAGTEGTPAAPPAPEPLAQPASFPGPGC